MATIKDKYVGTIEYYLVYSEFVTSARYRGLTTYQTTAQLIGLPLSGSYMSSVVSRIIGEISGNEVRNGRPMLSAVCVGVSGEPGSGFYGWAREIGRLKSSRKEDEKQFWQDECQAVYTAWARKFK